MGRTVTKEIDRGSNEQWTLIPTLADLDYADAFGYLANRLQDFQQNSMYLHSTANKIGLKINAKRTYVPPKAIQY